MDIAEAKARLRIPALWARLDLPGLPKVSCKSPFREDRSASFSVSADGALFNDFATGEAGDAVDFLQIATGLSPEAAFRKFIGLAGGSVHEAKPLPKRPAATPHARPKPVFPTFERGDDADLHRLAELRKVSFAACFLARGVGLLCFAKWKDKPAWIVTDNEGLNAQARRMDGGKWEAIDAKAQTLPGAWAGWPLGMKTGAPYPAFLLCEGGPDLLAALHFIHAAGAECSHFAVAMLGAKQRIHEDALPLLARKRVRIMAHEDEAGLEGAKRWARQLEAVGAEVDCFSFAGLRKADGSPVTDLNDATQIHGEDASELEGLLP